MNIEHANAICYSGYRENHNPRLGIYPSYNEVKQDLQLLATHWKYIRIYDCGPHADLVLSVIENEKLPLLVMLGADLAAEENNEQCPWGAEFNEQTLNENKQHNQQQIQRLIELATQFKAIVFAVSVGNEASVDWTDHLVSVDALIHYVRTIKQHINQPVTFCENYVPWTTKLHDLVPELDFISIHTYPVWEYKNIEEALEYSKSNYYDVANAHPNTPVIITEAGWTTRTNGNGIEHWNVGEELQHIYYQQLAEWTNQEKILTFMFEAFDEPWKGSEHPHEPEKHWGFFDVHREPKLVMQNIYADQ
jgi:exo-beta-1,3-glucanase (GH17 family)